MKHRYDIDEMPEDMPIEEWLWLTGQHNSKMNVKDEDAVASYYNERSTVSEKELP